MLTSFVIDNFKKFSKLELNDLARINIFLGNNNSGKSTVLEAIELSANSDFYNALLKSLRINVNNLTRYRNMPIRSRFDLVGNVDDYLRNVKDNKVTNFTVIIKESIDAFLVSIESTENIEDKKIELANDNNIPSRNIISKAVSYKLVSGSNTLAESFVVVDNENEILRNRVNKSYKIFEVRNFQTRDVQYIGDLYTNIVKNKQKELLLEKLKIFDSSILGFEPSNEGFFVDVGLDKMIPISYLGTGIISIVYLMIYMLNSENGVLLIDEIENGIYYKKIDKLIQVIDELSVELNVQLFITTHSEDFISRLGGFRDFALYRLNEQMFDGGVLRYSQDKAIDSISHADIR